MINTSIEYVVILAGNEWCFSDGHGFMLSMKSRCVKLMTHPGWNINQPIYALVGVLVYALSAVLLFLPLPPDVKWHYVVGIATIAYIFLG